MEYENGFVRKYDLVLNEARMPYRKTSGRAKLDHPFLNRPDDVAAFMTARFEANHLPEEHIWTIALNWKLRPVGVFEVSHGTGNQASMEIRQTITRILYTGAPAMMVVHNHPSGDPTPSMEDESLTRNLRDACTMVGINLIDHVIIGEGNHYFSFIEDRPEVIRQDRSGSGEN